MENRTGEMLESIERIIKEHEESLATYDDSYNIFDVLGLSTGETKMCRFLADLLNPHGAHKRGDKYLRSFLEDVLEWWDLNALDIKRIQVFTEYRIDNGKRIDIVLESEKCFLPIEVKIESGDRENQCYDYYQYARMKSSQAKVVYLTKRGLFPKEYSLCSKNGKERIPKEDIICISFAKDIRKWLEKNLKTETGIVKLMLEQYLATINNFTSVMDEELKMKISEKILETEDTFRTGLKIAETINSAKARLIYDVMEEFEKQMEVIAPKYGLMKEKEMDWFDYREITAIEASIDSKRLNSGVNYILKDRH